MGAVPADELGFGFEPFDYRLGLEHVQNLGGHPRAHQVGGHFDHPPARYLHEDRNIGVNR